MLNYKSVVLEVTRKCTRSCEHCMRGEAQDISMTREIIDKVFDAKNIESIILTGGEPLIEEELIKYIIQKCNSSNYTFKNKNFGSGGCAFYFISNGDIMSPTIIDTLSSFCLATGCNAGISISNDEFHDEAASRKTYEYYKERANAANNVLKSQTSGRVYIDLYVFTDKMRCLRYDGKAIQLIDEGLTEFKHGFTKREKNIVFNVLYPHTHKHRACISENTHSVVCMVGVGARGNVVTEFDDYSFFTEDTKLTIGNILEKPLENILLEHNNQCLILCRESKALSALDNIEYYFCKYRTQNAFYYYLLIREIAYTVIKLREFAHRLFPNLLAQDIIDALDFPNKKSVTSIIEKTIPSVKVLYCSEYRELVINYYIKQVLCCDSLDTIKYQEIFDECELMKTPTFLHLKELSDEYSQGVHNNKKQKVYDCSKIGDYEIDSIIKEQSDWMEHDWQ